MHVLHRDEFSASSRNSRASVDDLPVTAPTPPEGGWSAWYLTDEDDMGESNEQHLIIRLLQAALAELARERGWARTYVAGDQFFAWVEAEPLVRVSPDVYLMDDAPGPPYPGMWETWRSGHRPPRFAVEVVSDRWRKDYEDAPRKYDQLGASELIIFDPEAPATTRGDRVLLQVFRRDTTGALTRVAAGAGPVHSVELDAWLGGVPGRRRRHAREEAGTDLVATAEEQNIVLRRENTALRELVAEQARTIEAQARTIEFLEDRVATLEATIVTLEATIVRLEAMVTALLARHT